jgi:hypothetical protein
MSKLSTQVHELEKKAERLEHDNENLKMMLYRLIATNGNTLKSVAYGFGKSEIIKSCDFIISTEQKVECFFKSFPVKPNNLPEDL